MLKTIRPNFQWPVVLIQKPMVLVLQEVPGSAEAVTLTSCIDSDRAKGPLNTSA